MTYNQIVEEVRGILESHAMIKEVRFSTPNEWINREGVPELPIALFAINVGGYLSAYQNQYNIEIWLLDKSGVEGEFETEVTSDMHSIGRDIVNALGLSSKPYTLSLPISWNAISDKMEDYLSGITMTLNVTTTGKFSYCDFPTT
jgi:hypothetical protein